MGFLREDARIRCAPEAFRPAFGREGRRRVPSRQRTRGPGRRVRLHHGQRCRRRRPGPLTEPPSPTSTAWTDRGPRSVGRLCRRDAAGRVLDGPRGRQGWLECLHPGRVRGSTVLGPPLWVLVNEQGVANFRAICGEGAYIGVLGRTSRLDQLTTWALRWPDPENMSFPMPGLCAGQQRDTY